RPRRLLRVRARPSMISRRGVGRTVGLDRVLRLSPHDAPATFSVPRSEGKAICRGREEIAGLRLVATTPASEPSCAKILHHALPVGGAATTTWSRPLRF